MDRLTGTALSIDDHGEYGKPKVGKFFALKQQQNLAKEKSMDIETLVNKLCDPVDFAETYCGWDSSDYYEECLPDSAGGWIPADGSDRSIHDAAMDAVREWASETAANLETLRDAVQAF